MQLIANENSIVNADLCQHCGETIPHGISGEFCCTGCEFVHEFLQSGPISLINSPQKKQDFSYVESEAFQKIYGLGEKNILLYIEGVECAACIWLLENLPRINPQIKQASFDLSKRSLYLEVREKTSLASALESISALGYKPTPLANSSDYQKYYKSEQRTLGLRAIVAIVSFGNIMLLASGVYAGAEAWAKDFFEFINLGLCLPAVTYSSFPIYRQAFRSMRNKVSDINIPLSLSIVVAFLLSSYSVLFQKADSYFDSIAAFIAITLSIRWVYSFISEKYSTKTNLISYSYPAKICCINGQSVELIDPLQVKKGTLLKYTADQTLATDSILESSRALFDISTLTGESTPQQFLKGQKLSAGAKLCSKEVIVVSQGTLEESQIYKLMDKRRFQSPMGKNRASFLSTYSLWLTRALMALIPITGVYFYWSFDLTKAVSIALAVAIIACPCVIAFAIPLLESLIVKGLAKRGVIIKDSDVLETISKTSTIFFDKTGTLTEGRLELHKTLGRTPTNFDWQMIYLLESQSNHPISQALITKFSSLNILSPNFQVKVIESLGQGVSTSFNQKTYALEKLNGTQTRSGYLGCGYSIDGVLHTSFYFSDKIKPQSSQLISSLQKMGMKCGLLSGDSHTNVNTFKKSVPLSPGYIFSELSPTDKSRYIIKHSPCIMVGDGANDAEGLSQSAVGISVKGSLELALSCSDVYIDTLNISQIKDLIQVSRTHSLGLKILIAYSIVYNVVGITAALLNYISPLIAAILMPLNSLLILSICFALTHKAFGQLDRGTS